MSYFIYLRKSRKDEDLEKEYGDTLIRHRKVLLSLAKRMNLTITEIFEEVVSGESLASRPEIQRMLSEIERGGCDGVLVMEVERLARGDTVDQGIISRTFSVTGTKIITPTKTYDPENEFDQEYFEFGLFMSRREYKTLQRRQQAGRIASVKEGKFVCSTAPYGYRKVKIKDGKGYTLEPEAPACDVVKTIFDLYCGTGTIGLVAAARGAAGVTGVDVVESAIRDARANAAHNGIGNAQFMAADAAVFMRALAARRADEADPAPLVVMMDPPRSGASPEFLDALAAVAPERVVYISCDPATQARDIRHLARAGYEVSVVQPVDMFPHTDHIESIALLARSEGARP